ncbi:ABC transporter ATP-binding protein/permease [Spiroplasma sabaudiense Ar-1343]|uniref:ABC transporter ATP-binding protein/permease n=1 Tax=Spiroplasma sabaudiense Ar-1343 TaxID=1276257 RepID=W6ABB0_9MOLU|nr:ABC transporter ATP-binding protein [Spiroplasma sabaudiense]AHI54276.1 ABC transporter ATP-binding protein/permease [Spiroplasma sabaudiense Ar-1343]
MTKLPKHEFKDLEIRREIEILNEKLTNKVISDKQHTNAVAKLIKKDINLSRPKGAFFPLVIRYFKKHWQLAIIIITLSIISVLGSIAIPLLVKQMTTDIMQKNGLPIQGVDFWGLPWQTTLTIALAIVAGSALITYGSQYFSVLMGKKIEIDLRNRSLESLVRQDISYYSDKKIGEIITKVISDTQIVGDQAVQVPVTLINAFLTIIGASIMMFIFEATLAASVLGMFVVILLAMAISFAFTKRSYSRVREVVTDINGDVTDRVGAIRLVKASGTENYETNRFKDLHKKYYSESVKMGKIQALMITILFSGISFIQFISIGIAMIKYGNSGAAGVEFFGITFASFTMAQGIMTGPLFQVVMASVGIAQASVASTRVESTIEAESILDPHYNDGIKIEEISGDIIFKGVSFAYPEKPTKTILPKFDFTFKQGRSYAFVGETGSGKSTISRLLLRYYDPTEGQILINKNINLKDVNLSSYLFNIGYVEQDPQIIYGNVFDNVAYGRFDATEEEVIEACKKAELHNLIMTWPEGYQTILGERGFMLSGGQKQRMIIARMFLKDPKILILDEATSALDNIVEKEIQEKLEDLMVGRTTVSIAHRLSTIKNADEIIVLGADGAGIVQTGTFESLKSTPGHFKKLYEAGLMD